MATTAAVVTVATVLASAYYTQRVQEAEKKAAKRANRLASEQAAIDRKAELAELKETQRKNKNLLAQQQSSYKAKLGASGLTSRSGSGEVVLNSMQKETDMEDKYQQQKTQFTLKTLNNRLQQTNNRNLLTINKSRLAQGKNIFDTSSALAKVDTGSSA